MKGYEYLGKRTNQFTLQLFALYQILFNKPLQEYMLADDLEDRSKQQNRVTGLLNIVLLVHTNFLIQISLDFTDEHTEEGLSLLKVIGHWCFHCTHGSNGMILHLYAWFRHTQSCWLCATAKERILDVVAIRRLIALFEGIIFKVFCTPWSNAVLPHLPHSVKNWWLNKSRNPTLFKYMAKPAITACLSGSIVINSINCYPSSIWLIPTSNVSFR